MQQTCAHRDKSKTNKWIINEMHVTKICFKIHYSVLVWHHKHDRDSSECDTAIHIVLISELIYFARFFSLSFMMWNFWGQKYMRFSCQILICACAFWILFMLIGMRFLITHSYGFRQLSYQTPVRKMVLLAIQIKQRLSCVQTADRRWLVETPLPNPL